MYIYICIYIYIYIYYVCMYVYTHHMYICTYMHVHMHIPTYILSFSHVSVLLYLQYFYQQVDAAL